MSCPTAMGVWLFIVLRDRGRFGSSTSWNAFSASDDLGLPRWVGISWIHGGGGGVEAQLGMPALRVGLTKFVYQVDDELPSVVLQPK